MPKINKVAKTISVRQLKKTTETVSNTVKKCPNEFNFSTEERGFFICNGKVYNIIFPR